MGRKREREAYLHEKPFTLTRVSWHLSRLRELYQRGQSHREVVVEQWSDSWIESRMKRGEETGYRCSNREVEGGFWPVRDGLCARASEWGLNAWRRRGVPSLPLSLLSFLTTQPQHHQVLHHPPTLLYPHVRIKTK